MCLIYTSHFAPILFCLAPCIRFSQMSQLALIWPLKAIQLQPVLSSILISSDPFVSTVSYFSLHYYAEVLIWPINFYRPCPLWYIGLFSIIVWPHTMLMPNCSYTHDHTFHYPPPFNLMWLMYFKIVHFFNSLMRPLLITNHYEL